MKRSALAMLQCSAREECKEMALRVLDGEPGPGTDIIRLNAGAAIYVAGKVKTIEEGVLLASELIESGEAREKLEEIVSFTQSMGAAV